MLEVVDSLDRMEKIGTSQVKDYYDKGSIVLAVDYDYGDFYKLTTVEQSEILKYAFVEIRGHCWANGSHQCISSLIETLIRDPNGNPRGISFYVFESMEEYISWLYNWLLLDEEEEE